MPADRAHRHRRRLHRAEAKWEAVLRHVPAGPHEAVDRALWPTAIMVGLRHGELLALRWRDVDYAAMRVRLRQNYVLGQYDTPKSRPASRSLPMTYRLAGQLERLHRHHREPGPDALVFPDPITGLPLAKAGNLRRLRKALKAAAVDRGHNLTRCAARSRRREAPYALQPVRAQYRPPSGA